MPQSLDNVLVHLVFSTKDRTPWIDTTVRAGFHAYLATVARNAGGRCLRVGGVVDHVHLAIQLPRTLTIAALVEGLKTSSSKWMKGRSRELWGFAWQRGYGVFSVAPRNSSALLQYIDEQEKHHRSRTYQEEFRGFLIENGIAFDERYVWD
ncbi:MAG: IS200/IS605 family transposase [Planctomycetaceae bacterium]|nr:IS200/IS605 family transposase [Planctomycetaceae bacterium]